VQISGYLQSGKHDQVVVGTTVESMGDVLFTASVTMAFGGNSASLRLLATGLPVQSSRETLAFSLITLALRCVTQTGGFLRAQVSLTIVLSTSRTIRDDRRPNSFA
jgi:hypothetical protein